MKLVKLAFLKIYHLFFKKPKPFDRQNYELNRQSFNEMIKSCYEGYDRDYPELKSTCKTILITFYGEFELDDSEKEAYLNSLIDETEELTNGLN